MEDKTVTDFYTASEERITIQKASVNSVSKFIRPVIAGNQKKDTTGIYPIHDMEQGLDTDDELDRIGEVISQMTQSNLASDSRSNQVSVENTIENLDQSNDEENMSKIRSQAFETFTQSRQLRDRKRQYPFLDSNQTDSRLYTSKSGSPVVTKR